MMRKRCSATSGLVHRSGFRRPNASPVKVQAALVPGECGVQVDHCCAATSATVLLQSYQFAQSRISERTRSANDPATSSKGAADVPIGAVTAFIVLEGERRIFMMPGVTTFQRGYVFKCLVQLKVRYVDSSHRAINQRAINQRARSQRANLANFTNLANKPTSQHYQFYEPRQLRTTLQLCDKS